jgi:diguanylate cyclase (GGDEF)-like protein
MMVLFVDLDGLKWVNDQLGHGEGDAYLLETAEVLRDTFRASDVIGRLGGDEFAVLAIGVERDQVDPVIERLQKNIHKHNERPDRDYLLSLSIGTAHADPKDARPIDDLLDEADDRMYDQKRQRRRERNGRPGPQPASGERET